MDPGGAGSGSATQHETISSVDQLIPIISSLTPVTTAVPLIGVLSLTAIKDAYDDIVSYFLEVDVVELLTDDKTKLLHCNFKITVN